MPELLPQHPLETIPEPFAPLKPIPAPLALLLKQTIAADQTSLTTLLQFLHQQSQAGITMEQSLHNFCDRHKTQALPELLPTDKME